MKPDFERAAQQWLISPKLLEKFFDDIIQNSPSRNQDVDMMRAVASTVEAENTDFAREIALAYLKNENPADVRNWDGHSLNDFDADRQSQIGTLVPEIAKIFCKSVRLPQAKIYMLGDSQPQDLLSPEDKGVFHRVFNERYPHLETAIKIEDEAVKKSPKPKDPEWLLDDEPDFSGDRREEFRLYKEASEKYWEAKMIANTYLLPYWKRWEEENVRNTYTFPSVQGAEEREQYDEWRVEAAKRMQGNPPSDGFPPLAQG